MLLPFNTKQSPCLCLGVDVLPDIRLGTALTHDLVSGKVGVVGRGDEVMTERVAHILIHSAMLWIKHNVLLGQHVHCETIGCHELVFPSCDPENRC